MTGELKILMCVSDRIEYPDQVAAIRRDLNVLGFDATPETIQRAYVEWSDDWWDSSWKFYNGQTDRINDLLTDYLKVAE